MRTGIFITETTGKIGLQCVQRALLHRLLAPEVCNAHAELYYKTNGTIGLQFIQRYLLQRLLAT